MYCVVFWNERICFHLSRETVDEESVWRPFLWMKPMRLRLKSSLVKCRFDKLLNAFSPIYPKSFELNTRLVMFSGNGGIYRRWEPSWPLQIAVFPSHMQTLGHRVFLCDNSLFPLNVKTISNNIHVCPSILHCTGFDKWYFCMIHNYAPFSTGNM